VVTEVRVYVEGGGGKDGKARLREAFARFFGALDVEARRGKTRLRFILCGSRNQTYEDFLSGLRSNPSAVNLLLVDAERPVKDAPRAHLRAPPPGDGWDLSYVEDEQCHLMVEVMESWFLADPQKVAELYGKGFAVAAFPKTRNLETVSKTAVMEALKKATRATQKGEYHKMRHSPQILERLDPAKVRARAPHCDRLWTTIEAKLGGDK